MKSFSNLQVFCEHVLRKFGEPSQLSEEQIAEEFRRVYLKGWPLDLRTLRAVAASCGIKLNGLDKMPDNLRGYHEVYGDNKNIYFKKGDTFSGIQNTILHEIREMMETLFTEVCPGYESLRTSARHIAANKFASAVLLPEESFRDKVYETGFDTIALSKDYSKSCSQVLLRIGEVLQGRLFFYAALYENDSNNKTDWKVNYRTFSYNDDDLEANFHGVDGFFPKKGRPVAPGSLVDMAINKKKAHLVRQISILEDRTDEGLTAIARPLIDPKSGVIKVALVVMLTHDGHLLDPQIERAKPVTVENFHRHL
jgi:hypothetical protein